MSHPESLDPQLQVVLIDDDPHLRQALSQTLDLAGLKVLSLAEAPVSYTHLTLPTKA